MGTTEPGVKATRRPPNSTTSDASAAPDLRRGSPLNSSMRNSSMRSFSCSKVKPCTSDQALIATAGPLSDQADEWLRGIFINRVGSLDRAHELAESDPAVVAGPLGIDAMTSFWISGWLEGRAPTTDPEELGVAVAALFVEQNRRARDAAAIADACNSRSTTSSKAPLKKCWLRGRRSHRRDAEVLPSCLRPGVRGPIHPDKSLL
jgi:hypothetical protein